MIPKFFQLLYRIYLKIIRRNSFDLYSQRKISQFEDYNKISRLNERKKVNIINNAIQNVPFYKNKLRKYKNYPLEIFNSDFFVHKDNLRKNTESFIKKGINKNSLSWHYTGGSTGAPLLFATDKNTDAASSAAYILSLSWFNASIGEKYTIFWGSPTFINDSKSKLGFVLKKIKNSIVSMLMRRQLILNYNISQDNFANIYDSVMRFKPSYMRGMPSSLYSFALLMEENNKDFSELNLKFIHSACEQLYPWQKRKIEKFFCANVRNTYGLSEFGDIAFEAPCGNLHIMHEDVYVELIPDKYNQNELVVTQLNNTSTPLIRYKTGDIAESIQRCSCSINTPILNGIKGRSHDIIKLKNNKTVHGQMFTHVIVSIEGVIKYQVIQNKLDDFKVNLVTDCNYELKNNYHIVKLLQQYLGDKTSIEINIVNSIALSKRGKHRWIISNL